jgi:nitrogen fixation protein NifU and related proteins
VPEREPTLMEELYKDILLDHYRNPRHRGALPAPTCAADGANPLCGDQIHLDVDMQDGRIAGISFSGAGCSISQASASMMTEYVAGKPVADAERAIDDFQQMMLRGETPVADFGDIEALIGVAKFPARVKCASLAWKTLHQALAGRGTATPITTDERTVTP